MKDVIYASRIQAEYAPKNKFQTEVRDKIEVFDRLTVQDPAEFIQAVTGWVGAIKAGYPKCSPLNVEQWEDPTSSDIYFKIGDLVWFHLMVIEGRYTSAGVEPFFLGGAHRQKKGCLQAPVAMAT